MSNTDKLTLGPGQWIDRPAPKLEPALTRRVCDAINKGRNLGELADEINGDLDLTDDTIAVLRGRLAYEIEQRQKMDAALQALLDKRRGSHDR